MKNVTKALILSLIFSAVFYIFGIITGLKIFEYFYSENYLNQKYLEEMRKLRSEIENYIAKKDCEFIKNYLENVKKEIQAYREILPFRIENSSNIYSQVLVEYYKVQVLAWEVGKDYEKCNPNYKTILYFIDEKCDLCIKQGEELDKIRDYLISKGINVDIFAVGIKTNYALLDKIKKEFNISSAPSFIFNSRTFNFTTFEDFKNFSVI